MGKAAKIMRSSIHIFLRKYQFFTSTAAILACPYAVSVLLSQASGRSTSSLVDSRLRSLFYAAGFPSSEFLTILTHKLSQTISSSVLSLPFSLTFLLITKASVIQALNQQKPTVNPSLSSIISIYNPLLLTYISNSFLVISANATVFCLLSLAFDCLEGFGFSSPSSFLLLSGIGAVFYSVALANAIVIGNLALVLSGMERKGGFLAVLKAYVLMQGTTSMALSLALPLNLAMAAIEALFQHRIMRPFRVADEMGSYAVFEGLLIAYLYSIFVVLDAIVNMMIFKSCETGKLMDLGGTYSHHIDDSDEEEDEGSANLKTLEGLP